MEGNRMKLSYNRLWKLLIDHKMKKTDLRMKAGISTATISKLTNDEPVTLTIVMKICEALDCNVEDILELIRED